MNFFEEQLLHKHQSKHPGQPEAKPLPLSGPGFFKFHLHHRLSCTRAGEVALPPTGGAMEQLAGKDKQQVRVATASVLFVFGPLEVKDRRGRPADAVRTFHLLPGEQGQGQG